LQGFPESALPSSQFLAALGLQISDRPLRSRSVADANCMRDGAVASLGLPLDSAALPSSREDAMRARRPFRGADSGPQPTSCRWPHRPVLGRAKVLFV